MDFYCNICDKTINHKSKNKQKKTKRHYLMKNYVTNIYNYNDTVCDDVEKILHEKIMTNNNKFDEFKIYVSCRINDDVEIKVYKDSFDLRVVLPPSTFTSLYLLRSTPSDVGTLHVHVASKRICDRIHEDLSSKYDINCGPDMKIRNLRIKFVSRCGNMTYRYQLQQPETMIESKMVKHIKFMSHEEQIINYNFLTCKHKLSLL